MFIGALEIFKIGIGPSSSHTMGPMMAAVDFRRRMAGILHPAGCRIRCTLRGSLAFTGKGHATDRALLLGLHGFEPRGLAHRDADELTDELWQSSQVTLESGPPAAFLAPRDILFDRGSPPMKHPNGMIFQLHDSQGRQLLEEVYFSIGGGFIRREGEDYDPYRPDDAGSCPYPFDSAESMVRMAGESGLSIAGMKRANEEAQIPGEGLNQGLDEVLSQMARSVDCGLAARGELPGGLHVPRRAADLESELKRNPHGTSVNDWLCAYAMAAAEENAAGHTVVTAPTNGAAGVIPAVLAMLDRQNPLKKDGEGSGLSSQRGRDFLLTAAAVGGLIKHRGSLSGAEVGCQGEIGSASAMAAAGLCAHWGGTPEQIENAAEIALEHHLGLTCDPVAGLVQVPCIERNGFGAVKAWTAASLARRGSGRHFMPLDGCIAAMKQTGLEMSEKYKETSLGGLAVSIIEC